MKIVLKGGLEMYFDGNVNFLVDKKEIEKNEIKTLEDLIKYLRLQYEKSNNTLFRNDNELAPGNLCFVNKSDYEILQLNKTMINYNDEICFISTMHGG
ncbi:Ubiquitin- modifier 1 [Binucleata daphniae]